MGSIMRKPTLHICQNKGTDQLCSHCEADQYLCFHYTVQFLYFLNPKFPASSHHLWLFNSVCVRPVGWLIWVYRLTNSLGHMETGPQFIVPSDGLEKPGIEPATPGLQGE